MRRYTTLAGTRRLALGVLLSVVFSSLGCAQLLRPYQLKQRAKKYEQRKRYKSALRVYKEVLRIKPDDEEAKQRIEHIQKLLAKRYTEEASQKLAEKDYPGAVKATKAALKSAPKSDGVRAFAKEVVTTIKGEAKRANDAKDYDQALTLYQVVYDGFEEERPGLEQPIRKVKDTWSTSLAKRAKAAKRDGDALILYAKAASLTADPGHTAKRDELLGKLRAKHLHTVRVKKGRGASFTSAAAYLRNRRWLASVKIVQSGKADATLSYYMGRVNYDTRQTTRTASKRYRSGTKTVPNPQLESRRRDVARYEKEVARYEGDVARYEKDLANYQRQVDREGPSPGTSTMAEQGVSRSRSSLSTARDRLSTSRRYLADKRRALADTKPTAEVPAYADHSYTITRHTLTASASVKVEVFPTGKSGEKVVVSRRVARSASDESHPGFSKASLSEDPLSLPSRGSMAAQVQSAASSLAGSAVLTSLNTRRAEILERAKTAKDEDERVHWLVVYTVMNPGQGDPLVAEQIAELRGISHSPRLIARAVRSK